MFLTFFHVLIKNAFVVFSNFFYL